MAHTRTLYIVPLDPMNFSALHIPGTAIVMVEIVTSVLCGVAWDS